MLTESRKLHIIEAVLKSRDENFLSQLEIVIAKSGEKKKKVNALDFVGILSEEDGDLIEKAIEEGCEQIHPDDWK
jgi:hypothetical protein